MDQQTDCDEQHPCDAQSYSREYLFCMTASEPAGGVQCGFPGISDTFWTRAPWSGAQRRHVVLARRSPDAWTPVARLPAASQNVITMQHMDPATQRGSALQGSFQQASSPALLMQADLRLNGPCQRSISSDKALWRLKT